MSGLERYAQAAARMIVGQFPLNWECQEQLQVLQASYQVSSEQASEVLQRLIERRADLQALAFNPTQFDATVRAIIVPSMLAPARQAQGSPPIFPPPMANLRQRPPSLRNSAPNAWWALVAVSGVGVLLAGGATLYFLYFLFRQWPEPNANISSPSPSPLPTIQPAPDEVASSVPQATLSPAPSPEPPMSPSLQPSPTPSPSFLRPSAVVGDRLVSSGIRSMVFDNLCLASLDGKEWQSLSPEEQQQTAEKLLNPLVDRLSVQAREKMGSYASTEGAVLEERRWQISRSRRFRDQLYAETDARFQELFPAWAGRNLKDTGFDEVWFALHDDLLSEQERNARR